MAIVYLRSTTGNDANSGASWALAKKTLAAALSAAGEGGTVYVSQAHNEVLTATTTYNIPDRCRVLAVDDSSEPPTTLVSAADSAHPIINGDNGSSTYFINLNSGSGSLVHGIEFTSGTNYSGTSSPIVFDSSATFGPHFWNNCKFAYLGNGRGFIAGYNNWRSRVHYFINCILHFSSANSLVFKGGQFFFNNLILQGTAPSTLVDLVSSTTDSSAVIENSDLSAVSILANVEGAQDSGPLTFIRCKVMSGVALTSGARLRNTAAPVRMHLCDSANTNYRLWENYGMGAIVSETTVVKAGGASDGMSAYSLKCMCAPYEPLIYPTTALEVPVMPVWIDTVGSPVTITVDFVHDSQGSGTAGAMRNDQIWMEGSFLGDSSFPVGTFISNGLSNVLSTPSDQPASSATWTTTGMSSPKRQKLVLTFTPQMKGYFVPKVKIAKNWVVVYVDPKAVVS